MTCPVWRQILSLAKMNHGNAGKELNGYDIYHVWTMDGLAAIFRCFKPHRKRVETRKLEKEKSNTIQGCCYLWEAGPGMLSERNASRSSAGRSQDRGLSRDLARHSAECLLQCQRSERTGWFRLAGYATNDGPDAGKYGKLNAQKNGLSGHRGRAIQRGMYESGDRPGKQMNEGLCTV